MSQSSPSARCDRRCRRKPAVSAGCSCQASSDGRLPRRQRPSNRPCLCRRRRRLPFPQRPATAHLRRATSPRGCCRRWSQHPRCRSVCGGSRVMSGRALRRGSPLSAIRARWLRAPEDVPLGAWRAPAGASEDVAVATPPSRRASAVASQDVAVRDLPKAAACDVVVAVCCFLSDLPWPLSAVRCPHAAVVVVGHGDLVSLWCHRLPLIRSACGHAWWSPVSPRDFRRPLDAAHCTDRMPPPSVVDPPSHPWSTARPPTRDSLGLCGPQSPCARGPPPPSPPPFRVGT